MGPRPAPPFAATLVVLLAAAFSAVVFRPILGAYFWSDDFVLFYLLRDLSPAEFLLTPFGGHVVVARNAVFALTDALAGFEPRPYFVTVLATHALNVALLGRLVWRVTGSAAIAGAGALAWGTCPAAGDALAWYAVYSQVLATTCLLCAFDRLVRPAPASARDLVVAGLWLVLSALFFGSAIAVAALWPVVVVLLVPDVLRDRRRMAVAIGTALVVLLGYAGLDALSKALYAAPDVTGELLGWLVKRPRPALLALAQLTRVGVASLSLGAWWSVAETSDVVSWLVLLAAALAGAVAFVAGGADVRRRLVAAVLVALAMYGLIAIARAPLASEMRGWTAARVASTLRYQYAPQVFLAIALCLVVDAIARTAGMRRTVATVWSLALALGVLVRGVPLDLHDAARTAVAEARAEIAAQVAATPPGETAYVRNRAVFGFGWLAPEMAPLPGLAALFVIESKTDERDGRRVRFVEARPKVYEATQRHGSRLARLAVPSPPADNAATP